MKAYAIASVLVLTCTLTYGAQDGDNQKAELKQTMRNFASALELIQQGILYNKPDDMHKGAQLLDRNQKDFLEHHGNAIEMHMPDNPKFARSYATFTAGKIRDYIDKLSGSLGGPRDYSNIATYYTRILNECVSCHQKVRQW